MLGSQVSVSYCSETPKDIAANMLPIVKNKKKHINYGPQIFKTLFGPLTNRLYAFGIEKDRYQIQ